MAHKTQFFAMFHVFLSVFCVFMQSVHEKYIFRGLINLIHEKYICEGTRSVNARGHS